MASNISVIFGTSEINIFLSIFASYLINKESFDKIDESFIDILYESDSYFFEYS